MSQRTISLALLVILVCFCPALAQSSLETRHREIREKKQNNPVFAEMQNSESPLQQLRKKLGKKKISDRYSPKTLFQTGKEIGLGGRWYVLAGKKDGKFSEAQIGQEPGDVISVLPVEDAAMEGFVFG